ncbi:hypothetical protein [Streptomyces sp. NBC_00091]|uniref:hypothetical protein n=1 Tax=Streptomyces sp. NBC_00091 TaxID=2975648 RepID=UPI0022588C66|nr:hypothetical protein [Streptomyces sp. NBC_00091]MCX5379283.1 hypothetical protein [Streptomyces sp. NBC_00091]
MLHSPTDLAHRRTRPVHWVATASALAAVIAGAGLLQPDRATGATPAAGAPSAPKATAPDAHAATYPLDCKGAPHTVTDTAQGDLDGDGRPETVAAVRCDAGSGTPPHAIYVLAQDRQEGSAPRVVATLLDATRRRTATDLTVRDGLVTARLLGYSAPSVPRSSPDVTQLAKWRWAAGKFRQELTDSAAGSV